MDATQTDRAPRVVRRETPGSKLLLEIALGNAGVRKGGKGCACLISWAIAEHRVGHGLADDVEGRGHVTAAVRAYAEYWEMSESGAWDDLRAFRDAFPTEQTPARLVAGILAVVGEPKRLTGGLEVALAGA